MENPLLQPYHTLHDTTPFDRIGLEDYEPAIRKGMEAEDAEIQQIIDNPEAPTFENTVLALEQSGNHRPLQPDECRNLRRTGCDSRKADAGTL